MTVTDPFAPPVSDEPTLTTASTNSPWDNEPKPKSVGTVSVGVIPNLPPIDNGRLTLTFKGGTGFDAPWIVVRAVDLDDALKYVSTDAGKLADLMTRVQAAGSHFSGNGLAKVVGGATPPPRSAPPQGATEAPSWAPARHQPDAVYKTGVSKAGKTWHAWMSPEKGQYEPKFFYKD